MAEGTSGGVPVTPALVERLATKAEQGYEGEQLSERPPAKKAPAKLSRAMERVLELVEKGEIVSVTLLLTGKSAALVTTGSVGWEVKRTGESVRITIVALQRRGLVKLRAVGNPGKAALTEAGCAYRERARKQHEQT